MNQFIIVQEDNQFIQTKLQVDWLVNNTEAKVFDPVTFSGYQRKIDEKHVDRIVDYLNNTKVFLPTSIICSSKLSYAESSKLEEIDRLYIVDGQHRIEAFKKLRDINPKRYSEIKDVEMSVIIMLNPPIECEIETFITINKTSKKVDTSLAYVLRNSIFRKEETRERLKISHSEYLAVEIAKKLNDDETEGNIWNNRIKYEGTTKKSYEIITLNAFVKSTRALINVIGKVGVVNCDWDNNSSMADIEEIVKVLIKIHIYIWKCIQERWPDLFSNNDEQGANNRIIQGPIGYTAMNRYLITRLRQKTSFESMDDLYSFIHDSIIEINVDSSLWKPKGYYSGLSSESGYNVIVSDLCESIRTQA